MRSYRAREGPIARCGEIRFLLNGEERCAAGFPSHLTLLDYLRTTEHACGTKEGCAEGDCGACTVAVGEPVNGRMRYRAVNSCVAFLGQIDGKALLTVEGLADGDGDGGLHPVQQAMVETHGSQCGFCTPGFVMAMFAHHHEADGAAVDDDTIHDVLAGNLCRCTGYRPIVDALREASLRPHLEMRARDAATTAALDALRTVSPVEIVDGNRHFFIPRTVEELLNLLARNPSADILAGGTDLGLLVTKDNQKPAQIVLISEIPELREIATLPDHIRVGAAATYTDLLPAVEPEYPSFATLIRRFGSRQIRNLGTVGGNIATASPIGDTAPVLLALGATVEIASTAGTRELVIDEFFVAYRKTALRPGEFVKSVKLPRLASDQLFRTYKLSRRYDQDISAVCAAFRITLDGDILTDARIAYGGMAATPQRSAIAEAALIGQPWNTGAVEAAAQAIAGDFKPLTDFRGTAAYRLTAAANLVRRFQLETATDGAHPPTDVYAL